MDTFSLWEKVRDFSQADEGCSENPRLAFASFKLYNNNMPKPPAYLSKSKYLNGLQCHKLLWYEYNRKSAILPPDPAVQFAFAEGKRVGELAQQLFPGGIRLEREWAPVKHDARSRRAATERKPLFEAGFIYQQAYALADLLVPVEDDSWELIEVKSTTSVKEDHQLDAAFQKYVYDGAGLKIKRVFIMFIDREYIRQGALEPAKLFCREEITKEAAVLARTIERSLAGLLPVIGQVAAPAVPIGPYCHSPHECPLQQVCWAFLPEKDSVFDLYGGGKKSFDLLGQGIINLVDIPADTKLNYKQVIQLEAHRLGRPYIDPEAIREFLRPVAYPLYFLDFETLSTAIPLYDRTGPYKPVPFQFSLFIVREPGGEPERHGYLAPGDVDQRPEVLRRLKELLGECGSIIAYNATFERNCLRSAAAVYPEYQAWAKSLDDRFVDLLEPFTKFYYYHPAQQGKASLKNVLPALTGHQYAGLEIAEGGTATAEYYRVTFEPGIAAAEKEQVRQALVEYCDLDTYGMIDILKYLQALVK